MAHETVPADIAAAIQAYAMAVRSDEAGRSVQGTPDGVLKVSWARCDKALADLDAAILHHLRGVDEMKAALEAQTSGGA